MKTVIEKKIIPESVEEITKYCCDKCDFFSYAEIYVENHFNKNHTFNHFIPGREFPDNESSNSGVDFYKFSSKENAELWAKDCYYQVYWGGPGWYAVEHNNERLGLASSYFQEIEMEINESINFMKIMRKKLKRATII